MQRWAYGTVLIPPSNPCSKQLHRLGNAASVPVLYNMVVLFAMHGSCRVTSMFVLLRIGMTSYNTSTGRAAGHWLSYDGRTHPKLQEALGWDKNAGLFTNLGVLQAALPACAVPWTAWLQCRSLQFVSTFSMRLSSSWTSTFSSYAPVLQ